MIRVTALTSLLLLHASLNGIAADTMVPLALFDTSNGSLSWKTVDDPVMGGGSSSTITVTPGIGVWEGEVKVVKSLGKPGFCTVRTSNAESEDSDESGPFRDATGTEYLVVSLAEASVDVGLPVETFSVNISIKGESWREGGYRAQLSEDLCCGGKCQVPWDDFKISFRGIEIPGKKISDNLDRISRIGLSTSGTAGKFSVSIKSFFATDSVTPCNEGELKWW